MWEKGSVHSMGITYHVVAPTSDMLEASEEAGYRFPRPGACGRYPTAREIRRALAGLEQCVVRFEVGADWWEASVEEEDRTCGISRSELIVSRSFTGDDD